MKAYAIRCPDGPAKGLWWTGGGWGRYSERALYSSADEADEAAGRDLDPPDVDVVPVTARWDGFRLVED